MKIFQFGQKILKEPTQDYKNPGFYVDPTKLGGAAGSWVQTPPPEPDPGVTVFIYIKKKFWKTLIFADGFEGVLELNCVPHHPVNSPSLVGST